MALASLKARIERLQAKHKAEDGRLLGVIGYCDSQNWPKWDGKGPFMGVIGGVRFKPGEFTERCFLQQKQLMADVARYATLLGEEDPQAEAPRVGTTKEAVAPWPENRKRPKFVEIDGIGEIEIAKFKGLTRK